MPILLDDAPLDVTGHRLGDALQAAQAQCDAEGRMLVEVRLNGNVVTGDALDEHAEKSIDNADLRLYSADPIALSLSILNQIEHRLADAEAMQQEAAELLQRGESQAGLIKVGAAVEPWLQTQQAVLQSAALTGVTLDTLEVDGKPLQACITELVTRLKELRDLVNAKDTVALADVLQYEWPETTQRWRSLVGVLKDQIRDV